MKIDVAVDYTEKDITYFSMVSYFYARRYIWLFIFIYLFVFIGFVGSTFIHSINTYLVGAIIVLFLSILLFFTVRNKGKKLFRVSGAFKEKNNFFLTKRRIAIESGGKTTSLLWNDFTHIASYKRLYAFFISKNNAYILPKRSLTGDQIETINEFLASHTHIKRKVKMRKLL